jgi:hypothetical protein
VIGGLVGWLVDIPGVNAQERSREKLVDSLKVGAEDMLSMEVPFEPDAQMTTVAVKDPAWVVSRIGSKSRQGNHPNPQNSPR